MSYTINKSNLENNLLFLKLEDDSECFIKLTEIHEGSDIWTFYFVETDNKDKSFEHLCILTKEIFENDLLEKNKVSKLLILINGDDREDTDKKTEVFISMIKGDWEFKIDQDPETTIEGGSNYINFNTNSLYITKKSSIIICQRTNRRKYIWTYNDYKSARIKTNFRRYIEDKRKILGFSFNDYVIVP